MNAGPSPRPARRSRTRDHRPLRALELLEGRLAAGSIFPVLGLPGSLTAFALPWMLSDNAAPPLGTPAPQGSVRRASAAAAAPATLMLLPTTPLPQPVSMAEKMAMTGPAATHGSPAESLAPFETSVPPAPSLANRDGMPATPGADTARAGAVSAPAAASPAKPATSVPPTAAQTSMAGRVTPQAVRAPTAALTVSIPFPRGDQNVTTLAAAGMGGASTAEFLVTPDHGLWQHDDGGPWTKIGNPGTIVSVNAVAEDSGRVVGFVVTADHAMFRYDVTFGWQMLGNPGSIRAVSAGTDSSAWRRPLCSRRAARSTNTAAPLAGYRPPWMGPARCSP